MKPTRSCGVLMHITSLPSPEGIGTLGQAAYDFVDFLAEAGMRIWQMLPVGPVGGGDSPYQSASTFAGNAQLIDLAQLREDGLLDLPKDAWGCGPVDYPRVRAYKRMMLERAFQSSFSRLESEIEAFRQQNEWLDDYCLFEALREHFEYAPLGEWPDRAARMRDKGALKHYRALLSERIHYHMFLQYLFDRQWEKLKFYSQLKGVKLLGDLPIYVAADSADVWANPLLFKLDEERRPTRVAGVPPDYFTEDGQLWGNPVYDWKVHRKTGFDWWIKRMKGIEKRFDMVRIDHFIGLVNYYSVPYGAPNARDGKWRKAEGELLLKAVRRQLPQLDIVAEDLGVVNKRVTALRKLFRLPGMKILQFAYSSDLKNQDLPQNYKKNTVAYTGTHDNDTTLGWWTNGATEHEQALATELLGLTPDEDVLCRFIREAMMSRANTCILPMQDVLGLGSEARMNLPGTGSGNWRWRMSPDAIDESVTSWLKALVIESEREAKT